MSISTTSLMAVWELNAASGNETDAFGAKVMTETSGTIAATTGPGGVGGSRDIEVGDTEYFTSPDHADLSMGDHDFTITTWANLESTGALRTVLEKTGSGNIEYGIVFVNTATTFRFRIASATGLANLTSVNWSATISTATWYFIVAEHDATANTISISVNDGTAVTQAYTVGCWDGGGALEIGRDGAYVEYWDGQISQTAIFKRKLTGAERTELYNSGVVLPYSSWAAAAFVDKAYHGMSGGIDAMIGGIAA